MDAGAVLGVGCYVSSPTLMFLRRGYETYRIVAGKGGDHLSAYCCKQPKKKVYVHYKNVSTTDRDGGAAFAPCPESVLRGLSYLKISRSAATELYETFVNIKQYMDVFAVLAEFAYEFNWSEPWVAEGRCDNSNNGLCNLLVVDKVWKATEGGVWVPSYVTLEADEYTDYAMRALKNAHGCDSVRFVSTFHTNLFAGAHVLHGGDAFPPPPPPPDRDQPVGGAPDLGGASAPQPPLKKRKIRQANVRSLVLDKMSSCSNPTLIVLRQNYTKQDGVLVCPISMEIHLSNTTRLGDLR